MRRTLLMMTALLGAVTAAHADTAKDLTRKIEHWVVAGNEAPQPRFAFTDTSTVVAPDKIEASSSTPDEASAKNTTVAVSADKTATWIATDLLLTHVCGGCANAPDGWYHMTGLFDGKDKPVALHIATPVSRDEQKQTMAGDPKLEPVPKQIDEGAEDVAKLFETSIATPKTLAATVSPRKDVVLYGSELSERYVGGAKVKAQLAKWNLAFKIRDGIQAGVTSSKTVAWVAANVDATPMKNPKAKPVPYRALFIYERTIMSWHLVNAQFSFIR